MKLCVVGNSHLAAIKDGKALCAAANGVSIDWFGAIAPKFRGWSWRGGMIVPDTPAMRQGFARTSGGQDRIAVSEYDAFVFVGFFGVHVLVDTYDEHCTFVMRMRERKRLISEEVFCRIVAGWRGRGQGLVMARAIRDRTKKPVLVIERPRPAATLLDESSQSGRQMKWSVWRQAIRHGDAECLANMHERQCREIAADGLEVVRQRPSTVVDLLLTDRQLSVGSRRLINDATHGERDVVHMNGTYGAIVLDDVIAALAQTPMAPVSTGR